MGPDATPSPPDARPPMRNGVGVSLRSRVVVNARGDGTAGPVLTVGHTGDRIRAGTVRDARMVVVEPDYHPAGEGENG